MFTLITLILSIIDRRKYREALKKNKYNIESKTKIKAKFMIKRKFFRFGLLAALLIDIVLISFILIFGTYKNRMDQIAKSTAWMTVLDDPVTPEDEAFDWQFYIEKEKEEEQNREDEVQNGINSGIVYNSDQRQRILDSLKLEYDNYIPGERGYKYCVWGNKVPGAGNLGSDYAWCATFTAYCFELAGLTEDSAKKEEDALIDLKDFGFRSCTSWVNYMRKLGWEEHNTSNMQGYTPKAGDVIVFYKDGAFQHIGMVFDVVDGQVWTIEGNTTRTTGNGDEYNGGNVNLKNRKTGTSGGYWNRAYYFTPPYAVTEVNVGGTGPSGSSGLVIDGEFDLSRYQKGSDGYYDRETVQIIFYDFLMQSMGYNSAAACGALGNLKVECQFMYDIAEVDGDGILWEIDLNTLTSKEYKTHRAPTSYFNGNYGSWTDKSTIIYCPPKYNLSKRPDGWSWSKNKQKYVVASRYAGGYGIIQWSDGRREKIVKRGSDPSWAYGESTGPNSLMSQLMYMKEELQSWDYAEYKAYGDKTKNMNDMYNVPNTLEGARAAASLWASDYEINSSNLGQREDLGEEMWNKYKNRVPLGSSGLS